MAKNSADEQKREINALLIKTKTKTSKVRKIDLLV